MNFKIEDTAWASGVGASILSFLIGLFTAFSLAGSNVFIINLLLLLVAIGAILSGIALLLAATEVYMKLHRDPETKLSKMAQRLYRTAMGEELDVAKAYQVLEAVQAHPKTIMMPAVEITETVEASASVEDNDNEATADAYKPMTPEQIIAASLIADTLIKDYRENIHVPAQPVKKPMAHSFVDTQQLDMMEVKTSNIAIAEKPSPEEPEEESVPETDSIIVLGPEGISPQSEEFKSIVEHALEKSMNDESYRLRLTGKTYGIGARGTKMSENGVEFTTFGQKDLEKVHKKMMA